MNTKINFRKIKILRIVTGLSTLGSGLFSYMSFNIPVDVKGCFNVQDSFWTMWGYIFFVCAIVWGVGFISTFGSCREGSGKVGK